MSLYLDDYLDYHVTSSDGLMHRIQFFFSKSMIIFCFVSIYL